MRLTILMTPVPCLPVRHYITSYAKHPTSTGFFALFLLGEGVWRTVRSHLQDEQSLSRSGQTFSEQQPLKASVGQRLQFVVGRCCKHMEPEVWCSANELRLSLALSLTLCVGSSLALQQFDVQPPTPSVFSKGC